MENQQKNRYRKNFTVSQRINDWIVKSSDEIGITQSAFLSMKLNEQMNAERALGSLEKISELQQLAEELQQNVATVVTKEIE